MPSPRETLVAYGLLAVMPLFLSSNIIIGQAIAHSVEPWTLTFLRWGGALVILLPFVATAFVANARALGAQIGRLAILAVLGMGVCGVGVYVGLRHTSATNATLIYTTSPALVLVLERLVYGRKLSWLSITGVTLAIAGVVTIVTHGHPEVLASLDVNTGDLWIAAGALAWAAYSLILRNEKLRELPTLPVFFAIILASVVMLAPFAVIETMAKGFPPASLSLWVAIAALALLPSVIAFSLFQFGVNAVGASATACFLYLLPVYGVVLAIVFLGESLHGFHLVGMALVLIGVVAATLPADLLDALKARLRSNRPPADPKPSSVP